LARISGVTSNSSAPFLLCQIQRRLPARQRKLFRYFLREPDGIGVPVLHAQHRNRRTESEKAHAVAAFAMDFIALQR
jgi:hypothetical protein